MPINSDKSEPLYHQVAKDIKTKIASGRLKTGDKLPSQNELSNQYNVSLITIKKALTELNREGIINGKVGKGTYIANRSVSANNKKLKTIGFVLRDMDSPYFSRILSSAEKKLSSNEWNLLVSSSAGKEEKEENMINHFLDIGISGLIIASMARDYCATPTIRKLHENNFPYIVVSYMSDEDISSVGTNQEQGGYLATEHLIKLGYKRIGYINADPGNLLGDLRKRGYLRAHYKHKMLYDPDSEYQTRLRGEWHDYHSGYEVGQKFVVSKDPSDAMFVWDDLTALGFQKALFDNGLRVPEDVAIIGFDDIKRGVTALVPLTTIHQPSNVIGELAADILLKKITGEPYENRIILQPSLIVRDSCGARLKDTVSMNNSNMEQRKVK